jgi:hypothetical protein
MKISIMITIFSHEDNLIVDYLGKVDRLCDELKYEKLKVVYGKHRQSKRAHTHMTCILETNGSKTYKGLDSKVRRSAGFNTSKTQDLLELFQSTDYKISVRTALDKGFNEMLGLGYPLKEYDNDGELEKDIRRSRHQSEGGGMFDLAYGVTDKEVYELRKEANDSYQIAKAYRAKQEEQELKGKNQKLSLYAYLDTQINIFECNEHVDYKLRLVIKEILLYYKKENKSFRLNGLKDMAINYLYQKDLVESDDIITLLHF